jgi:hypothetical protein
MFHVDLSNMCLRILTKGEENFIYLIFNLQKLRSYGFCAFSSGSDFAFQKVHIECIKGIPIFMSLILIDTHFRIIFKDTLHLLLVSPESFRSLFVFLITHLIQFVILMLLHFGSHLII